MPRRFLHVFPTFTVGGSQVRLAQIANHFRDAYQHVVYATDGDYGALKLFDAGVPITKLEHSIDKRLGLAALPQLLSVFRNINPDIVVTHNWGAIEWALATRFRHTLRHVHIEDGFGPDEAERQLPRRVWFRRLALTGQRTTVVVPSRSLFEIATRIWALPTTKVSLIPNGIDLKRFAQVDPAQACAEAKKREGEILIGTVARLRPEKNLGVLIHAFAKLPAQPAARLFIVGDGSELESLTAIAQDAGALDRVVFFGHTQRPEFVLRAFDIFAMSSETEQMPLGLLEAMACGLPVAATAVGDIPQMVAQENSSFLVPRGAIDALASALRQLIDSPSLRAQIGKRNLAKVTSEYDQELMFERYRELFGR